MSTVQGNAVSRRQTTHARFGRYAWGVLAYSVFVVLWGGLVRATSSGAGCGGHWPLCNGDIVPHAPTVAAIIEYTHRLMSGLAIAAVAGLWVFSRREFPRHHRVRKLAGLSLAFLAVEALLGAGLVLFDYVAHNASAGRAFYLALHLANTQVLLAVLTLTAWLATRAEVPLTRRNIPATLLAALPLVVLLSMTGAVAALGDTLFPARSLGAGIAEEFSSAAHFLLRLRMVHPAFAVLAGFYLLYAVSSAVRACPSTAVKRQGAALAGLVLVQLCAGAVNIALLAPVWMQLAHLLVADLVWIVLVVMAARIALNPPGEPAPGGASSHSRAASPA
jgi:heme A synthase